MTTQPLPERPRKRFYLDTEFMDGTSRSYSQYLQLISLGVVDDDGNTFYAINADAQMWRANDWVRENVLPLLPDRSAPLWMMQAEIAARFKAFIGDAIPEFWGDCCAYDYVVITSLLSGMACWPEGWPYYFNDVAALLDTTKAAGIDLAVPNAQPHNALEDARAIRALVHAVEELLPLATSLYDPVARSAEIRSAMLFGKFPGATFAGGDTKWGQQ